MHLAMQCILNWGIFKYIQCRWRVINYMKLLPYPTHTHTHTKLFILPAQEQTRSRWRYTQIIRKIYSTLASGQSTSDPLRWSGSRLAFTVLPKNSGVKVAKASHCLIRFPGAMPLQSPSAEFPPSNQEWRLGDSREQGCPKPHNLPELS